MWKIKIKWTTFIILYDVSPTVIMMKSDEKEYIKNYIIIFGLSNIVENMYGCNYP